METAKHSYEASLIQNFPSAKPNKIFKYLSAIKSNNQIPSHMYLGNTSTTDEDKTTLLNQYIFSVFTHSTYQLPSIYEVTHAAPILDCVSIDEQQIYEVLLSLDSSKSAGIDTINPLVLKHCAMPLAQPLYHLFCHYLSTCNIPSEWQIHCINPIFKSGDNSNETNFSLCVVSKVLERLIYVQPLNQFSYWFSFQPTIWISGWAFLTTTASYYCSSITY